MRFVRAEKSQLPEILELQKLCYRSEAEIINDFTIEPLTQTLEALEKEFETRTVLVLTQNRKIIASVRGDRDGGTCRIWKVIVHPDYQNLGIGTRMLNAIQEAFPDVERYELFTGWKSEKNLALYRKNGFTDFAEKRVNDALTLIYLEKYNRRKVPVPGTGETAGIHKDLPGKPVSSPVALPFDFSQIRTHAEYKNIWAALPPLELKMVERYEECRHCVGDTFTYRNPYEKPQGVCNGLLHVLDLFTWRATLGFPSWNPEERLTYRIHCPDPKGTVWELRRKEKPVDPTAQLRRVDASENLERFAGLIRRAFSTVAQDLRLTRENCPGHPSFLEVSKLAVLAAGNTEFFCLEQAPLPGEAPVPVGFIALEKSATEAGVFYIEKLAVHPDLRHEGLGKRLMEAAENRARELGGTAVSVALINEQTVLKNWYASLGYMGTGTRTFPHLPFTVCFMKKELC